MPLNTLRLNHAPSSHPNPHITFIKPLPLPTVLASATSATESDYHTADTFLHAIAAQCLPIMKKHHLSITTLEEHEPNREFIGRNFNNGEIIQLVLRSRSGAWLPFDVVQMVMMHELAHNTHMNHGKGFWEVRNGYVAELRGLWAKGYTGEGFWGGGRRVGDMNAVIGKNVLGNEKVGGLSVCGGTYRSRRRKRRAKEELSWKEKRDRRIEKKFGKNGVSLGEDEDKRFLLEMGKKGGTGAKPRVAGSARGRELRAAAALARFETNKKEAAEEEERESKEESLDSDDYEDADDGLEEARDTDGSRLLDGSGRGLVKVCDQEDSETDQSKVAIKKEMEELSDLRRYFSPFEKRPEASESAISSRVNADKPSSAPSRKKTASSNATIPLVPAEENDSSEQNEKTPTSVSGSGLREDDETICPICSLSNPSMAALACGACAHVLRPDLDKHHWPCPSENCRDLGYVNAGDVGICGLCGTKKSTSVK
jgi:DNA-dependent metalloprotease WSS1